MTCMYLRPVSSCNLGPVTQRSSCSLGMCWKTCAAQPDRSDGRPLATLASQNSAQEAVEIGPTRLDEGAHRRDGIVEVGQRLGQELAHGERIARGCLAQTRQDVVAQPLDLAPHLIDPSLKVKHGALLIEPTIERVAFRQTLGTRGDPLLVML